jgi:hypothetical protein
VEHAQQALAEARDKLVRQRHRAALLGVMVLGLAAAAVVATQFGAGEGAEAAGYFLPEFGMRMSRSVPLLSAGTRKSLVNRR